jgi:hypothetical protein
VRIPISIRHPAGFSEGSTTENLHSLSLSLFDHTLLKMVSTIALLAVLGFGASTLANIYPDIDPCNPAPPLEGEYQGEYGQRPKTKRETRLTQCRHPHEC